MLPCGSIVTLGCSKSRLSRRSPAWGTGHFQGAAKGQGLEIAGTFMLGRTIEGRQVRGPEGCPDSDRPLRGSHRGEDTAQTIKGDKRPFRTAEMTSSGNGRICRGNAPRSIGKSESCSLWTRRKRDWRDRRPVTEEATMPLIPETVTPHAMSAFLQRLLSPLYPECIELSRTLVISRIMAKASPPSLKRPLLRPSMHPLRRR